MARPVQAFHRPTLVHSLLKDADSQATERRSAPKLRGPALSSIDSLIGTAGGPYAGAGPPNSNGPAALKSFLLKS